MLAAQDPDKMIAGYAAGCLILMGLWRMFAWLRDQPVKADPWGAEIDLQLKEAQEVCPHCSTLQSPEARFCPRCDRVVGSCHSFTPYVFWFTDGNIFRHGHKGQLHASPLIVFGYAVLCVTKLGLFACVYGIFFLYNQRRIKRQLMSELRDADAAAD